MQAYPTSSPCCDRVLANLAVAALPYQCKSSRIVPRLTNFAMKLGSSIIDQNALSGCGLDLRDGLRPPDEIDDPISIFFSADCRLARHRS